jgi:predicted permease
MRKLRAWIVRFLATLHIGQTRAEIDSELSAHIAMNIEDNLRAGLSAEESRRQALIQLGGEEQARQAYRDRAILPFLEGILQDVRFTLRQIRKSPGFTLTAVLTLAIGIGASTTAFSWINSVLLQPLSGVADPGQLVVLESVTPNGELVPNSYPDFIDFRKNLKLLDSVAVSRPSAFSVGREDHAERVWGELVSGNFFAVLGVKPEVGRLFLPAEYADTPNNFPIAVISDRYWRSHYGADPSIVGRTIRINQHELTVVGVAAPQFHGSLPVVSYDLWVPYMQQPALNSVKEWMLRDRHNRNMLGIARLRPGVTVAQARQELKALADRMAIANADVSLGMSATLLTLAKSPHGPQGLLAGPLRILMGVSILVLLIVCVNVANLLMARATHREKEFSARLALGAGRGRLIRQVLTESLLLAACGALLGIASTPLLTRSLKLLMPPGSAQSLVVLDTRPNFTVIAFTAGLCVLTSLAAGLLPALHVSRMNLNARLNDGGRTGSAGRSRNRLRSALVAAEVALALVTLVGAGLFAHAFEQTMHIDPGFDPNGVLLSQFYLNTNGYDLKHRKEFCRRLVEQMSAAPGVTDVAYSDGIPLGFEPSWWEELDIEGYARQPGENMNIFRNVISPGYLPLMHIPIVEGRNFTENDNEVPDIESMIVNESFARRFFAGRDPIGKKVHGWGSWFRIVGVAKDSKYHYLGEGATPYFYVPFRQVYREDMNLAFYVRAHGDLDSVLTTLRAKTRAIDPNVTVFDAAPLKEFIGASLYPQKVAASVMTVMGGIAILLASMGLYSVMAYWVAQRTQEIGVRMALGAQPAHVLILVVRKGLAITFVGAVAGMICAFILSRAIAGVSYTNSAMGARASLLDSNATNPLIYAASAAFLCCIALLACLIPARRAASINPTDALRTE